MGEPEKRGEKIKFVSRKFAKTPKDKPLQEGTGEGESKVEERVEGK